MNSREDRAVYWFHKEFSEGFGIHSEREIKEDFPGLVSKARQERINDYGRLSKTFLRNQ